MGEHFERVAAVYESLRTTDEAPVRRIGQLLPDRPVTGLDIGCGTGRYTGCCAPAAGRLAAGRQRRLGGHAGTAQGRQPRPRPWGGAAAGSRRTAAVAGRQPRRGHRVQLRSPLRPRPLPDRRRPGAGARRPAVHLHPHPAAERANDLGPLLPGLHRTRAAPAQPGRAPGRRQADRRAHWSQHRPSSIRAPARPSGSRPRPRGATTRHSPSTPRKSCAHPSRPSWPACPAPRSPGLTSTSWSSPARATTTRRSLTAQAAGRARRSRIRPPRSAPRAPARLPTGVPAAARRSPRYAPSRLLATTFGRAPRSADIRATDLRLSSLCVSMTNCRTTIMSVDEWVPALSFVHP